MKRSALLILLFMVCQLSFGWDFWPLPMAEPDLEQDSLLMGMRFSGLASTGKFAPFFLQANQNGNISPEQFSGNASLYFGKPATRPHRWFDYDFALQYTIRVDNNRIHNTTGQKYGLNYYFNQAYAHCRLYVFDLTAGITPFQLGPQDPTLSTGGLLLSTNALPMPRVTIGIEKYTAFPGLFGFVEIKGAITHGWFIDNVVVQKSFLHYAYAGVRLFGDLPFNLSYEFHHAAQWGGYSPVYGDLGNDWKAFGNAVTAKAGGTMGNDQHNAQGNHIGWQILDLDLKGTRWKASLYWQSMFEDGPVRFMAQSMNVPDGLWGIHIEQWAWPFINGFTYEFLNTTDQSGPYHDRDGFIYGGNDSYFRNSIYPNGWNYFYHTLGTPYITSPLYTLEQDTQTTNNRVKTHFLGLRGDIFGYRYRFMASYTRNYGRYQAECLTQNTALLLEVTKCFEKAWGIELSLGLSADFGNQFGNNFGAFLSISKTGVLCDW